MKVGVWTLASFDKLVKYNNGVKYILVRQDLFDRTVDAKGMKTKDSKEAVLAFSTMITKNNPRQKICVNKATENAGEFQKLCEAEILQVYPTMSETKPAFANRTIRSLTNILYRYVDDYAYKYIHELSQFNKKLNSTKKMLDRFDTTKYDEFRHSV